MLREKSHIFKKLHQFTDLAATAGSFLIAYFLRSQLDGLLIPLWPFTDYVFLLYIIVPLWAILLRYNGAYQSLRTNRFTDTMWPILKTVFTGGIILMTVLFLFHLHFISRLFIFMFLLFNLISLALSRALMQAFVHYIRKRGYNYRTCVIVGTGRKAEAFADNLKQHREWGVKVLGFIAFGDPQDAEPVCGEQKIIGRLESFEEIITECQVDEVIFAVPRSWLNRIEDAIMFCEKIGIKASIVADFYPHTIAKAELEDLRGWQLLTYNPSPHIENAVVLKRVIDLALSAAVLIIIAPLFAALAIIIKLSSSGPVFFMQERCGLNGRRFKLFKFRTMVKDADSMRGGLEHLNEMKGPVFKLKNDPRLIPIGKFLRKYSLDELPQFINVLKGDMSIVGPRPPLAEEVEKYETWQRRRLSVRPGITCLWQVGGRNKMAFDDWMKIDLEYIDNWTIINDMKIILKTIPVVIRGTGV